jgi:hypothetical protein
LVRNLPPSRSDKLAFGRGRTSRHYAILTNPKTLSMLPKSIFIVPSFPRFFKRVGPFLKNRAVQSDESLTPVFSAT